MPNIRVNRSGETPLGQRVPSMLDSSEVKVFHPT